MRVSAIEIGTNSTKLIIMEANSSKEYKILKKISNVNRLSKNMFGNNLLTNESMLEVSRLLSAYVNESDSFGAKLVSVFSTSVLRDAINGEELVRQLKNAHGVDIDIISGEHEAFLAYLACESVMVDNDANVIVDIGGGSTELVFRDKDTRRVGQRKSVDIGAVRLTETLVRSDPISDEQYESIYGCVNSVLSEHDIGCDNDLNLIGIGGTIKTMGRIYLGAPYDDEDKINGLWMARKDVCRILDILRAKSLDERKYMQGLDPKRADVITCGAIILRCIMERFSIERIMISTNGIIEGLIFEYMMKT